MSNLTDFLDDIICALDDPANKTLIAAQAKGKIEDGMKDINERNPKNEMSDIEKKIAQREYLRNYMREYKKVYVQPEINKSHNTRRRRKYGTALITSARIRKDAEKNGIIIRNSYKIKIRKEQTDEAENKVCEPNSPTDIQK